MALGDDILEFDAPIWGAIAGEACKRILEQLVFVEVKEFKNIEAMTKPIKNHAECEIKLEIGKKHFRPAKADTAVAMRVFASGDYETGIKVNIKEK